MINSELYRRDIEKIVTNFPYFEKLKNKSFLITGANGLICSALVDLLIYLTVYYKLNITLFLAVRNVKKTKVLFNVSKNKFIKIVPYDATKKLRFNKNVDYYIHGASPASPNFFISNPIDTMKTNISGLEEILKKTINKKSRVLFISSSEVYGILNNKLPISESEYGYIDILNPRSSYSESKKAAETLCVSYKTQKNVDVVIARPGHIFGPTATENDKRVSSEFMHKASKGQKIVLKSKGEQIRSYVYCLDCAMALIYILLNGTSGEVYNISNKKSICSIKQMAEFYAKAGNVSIDLQIPIETEKKAFNPMINSSLNSEKLEALGWLPSFSMEEGFTHSVQILKEKRL